MQIRALGAWVKKSMLHLFRFHLYNSSTNIALPPKCECVYKRGINRDPKTNSAYHIKFCVGPCGQTIGISQKEFEEMA